jgi:hypothetical protein
MKRLAFTFLLALTSCHAERALIEEGSVTAVPGNYWAGNEATLVSQFFRGVDSLPLVTFGAETLAVRAGGPDTVLVTLPTGSGFLDLSVSFSDGSLLTVPVRTYGFVSRTEYLIDLPPAARLVGGEPTTLGLAYGPVRHLVEYNFRTKAVRILASTLQAGCGEGSIGPSAADPTLVMIPTCRGLLLARAVLPPGLPADSFSQFPVEGSGIQLNGDHWMTSMYKRGFMIWQRPAGGGATLVSEGPLIDGARGYVVSPRRDRVVPRDYEPIQSNGVVTVGGIGIAVYDPVTATPAFTIPGNFIHVGGSAFSTGGDTLYVMARDTSGLSSLLVVNATTGAVLQRAVLHWPQHAVGWNALADVNEPGDVVATPLGRWLYVTNGSMVGVLDRATLARVATLRLPPREHGGDAGNDVPYAVLVADPPRNRLYLAGWVSSALYRFTYEFEVMP